MTYIRECRVLYSKISKYYCTRLLLARYKVTFLSKNLKTKFNKNQIILLNSLKWSMINL